MQYGITGPGASKTACAPRAQNTGRACRAEQVCKQWQLFGTRDTDGKNHTDQLGIPEDIMKKFKVRGMQSPDCAATVSQAVSTVDGVETVNVNLATGEVTYGPTACVDMSILKEAVEQAGYEVEE
jgi:copper chaperone CopZ